MICSFKQMHFIHKDNKVKLKKNQMPLIYCLNRSFSCGEPIYPFTYIRGFFMFVESSCIPTNIEITVQ